MIINNWFFFSGCNKFKWQTISTQLHNTSNTSHSLNLFNNFFKELLLLTMDQYFVYCIYNTSFTRCQQTWTMVCSIWRNTTIIQFNVHFFDNFHSLFPSSLPENQQVLKELNKFTLDLIHNFHLWCLKYKYNIIRIKKHLSLLYCLSYTEILLAQLVWDCYN